MRRNDFLSRSIDFLPENRQGDRQVQPGRFKICSCFVQLGESFEEHRTRRNTVAQLNTEQMRAVNTLGGPMLVLAGAGTGKTRVVTFRIAKLIKSGIDPTRILAVTFTNKAAREMHERISELLGRRQKKKPQISTFHSHCVRVLRRHGQLLGYPKNFAIYGPGDQESLARQILKQVISKQAALKPSELLFWISHWKSKSIRPDDAQGIASSDKTVLAARAYALYQRELKNAGAMDFDDLLLMTEELFQVEASAAQEEAERFDHILVDEYQDTNQSQYRIVKKLASAHRNLCVVGDDDQSIYAWRGAEVQHILNFKQDWPDAEIFCLEENYRSTSVILELANRLIEHNSHRHIKQLKSGRPGGTQPAIHRFSDETREAAEIVADIRRRLTQPGIQPRDFAILFRASDQSRPFETELRKMQVPYVLLGGQSFFDRREIKDILAYLRLVESPGDEIALRRILNTPPRGVGQKARDILVKFALDNRCSLWKAVCQQPAGLGNAAATGLRKLVGTIRNAKENCRGNNLVNVANTLIAEIDYRSEIDRQYELEKDRDARWDSVEQLVNALGSYVQESDEPKLSEFVDQVTLGDRDTGDDNEKKLDRNAVILMTMHSAKGLEFPNVYIVGVEEGILPHKKSIQDGDDAIEEERRLAYVGVTRAEESLTLSMALSRMKWGKPRQSRASRFLYEITGQTDHPNYLRCLAETGAE